MRHFACTLLLACGILAVPVFAQNSTQRQQRDNTDTGVTLPQAAKAPEVPAMIAVDGAVNPDVYIVGPSDVFGINIWSVTPLSFMLPVSPEGSLVIPTVGEVPVADLTLREAKARVLRAIGRKYLAGEPTVTLMAPRQVIVNVEGHVQYPGKYTVLSMSRVDGVLEEANRTHTTPAVPERNDASTFDPTKSSRRHILMRHRDGTSSSVDLDRYVAAHDDRFNPYLRGGDVIIVPAIERGQQEIGIYGAVLNPSRFEFVEGDSLTTLLRLGHGFNDRARLDSVLFTRFDSTGERLTERILDLRLLPASGNFPLQSGDRIFVPERRDDRGDFRVTVEGEVRQPGIYPILKSGTKVSEVLRLCGGPTDLAALNGASLIRKGLNRDQRDAERLVQMRGMVVVADTAYVRQENEYRYDGERVDVDFVRLVVQHDSTQDVPVLPGDRLVVPRKVGSVYVFGQVANPSQIALADGRSASYYVQRAGGFTDRARSANMVVIKRGSRQWLDPGETTVEDGDAIWVPKERDRDFSYYLGIAGQFASILTTAVTVIILVNQLK